MKQTTPQVDSPSRDQVICSAGRTLAKLGRELISTSKSDDDIVSMLEQLETLMEDLSGVLGVAAIKAHHDESHVSLMELQEEMDESAHDAFSHLTGSRK